MHIVFSALSFFLLPAAAEAAVVFQENYESGSLSKWEAHGGCYDYSFNVIADPAGGTNKVLRVINRMAEDNRTCSGWEGQRHELGYKRRAELNPANSVGVARYNVDHWVGQRMFMDPNWPSEQPGTMTLTQIIPVFDDQEEGTDMKMRVSPDQELVIEIRGGGTARIGKIKRGQWENFVFHYKRHLKDGVVEVWRNGVKVVDYRGPSTYTTDNNGNWKHGVYVGQTSTNNHEYKLYFDDVKIATGADQYAAVNTSAAGSPGGPANPGTPTVPTGPTLCARYLSGVAATAPYGLAWNWLSSGKELLMSAVCETGKTTIIVGKPAGGSGAGSTVYTWGKIYNYTGSTWDQSNPIQLTCNGTKHPTIDVTPGDTLPDFWCHGTVTGVSPVTTTFFVGYTCIQNGSVWQCGCTTPACTKTGWQLQGITR